LDTNAVKLYDHQLNGAKFLLDRETVGLSSILNFDTGMGKTATVIYAYKQNPISTIIIVRKKYRSIWEKEMIKHGVNIHIATPSQINEPITKYKRVIMDEIHEALLGTTSQNYKFAEYLKNTVIWGLTAIRIVVNRGEFQKAHLQAFFGAPDCVKTVKIHSVDKEIRDSFKLPKFTIVNTDIDKERIETMDALAIYLDTMYNYVSREPNNRYQVVLNNGSVDYCYDLNMYNEFHHRLFMFGPPIRLPKCINQDGSISIDGKIYTTLLLKQTMDFCGSVRKVYAETKLKEIVDQHKDKRIIVYTDEPCFNLWHKLESQGFFSKSHSTNCDKFSLNEISLLVLPIKYNAGFNLGKIDIIVVLSRNLLYNDFYQMMGRVNRLDCNNITEVYILASGESNLTNASSVVSKYKIDFVM
jgi:superfamily II DNA or RNA helicase